MFSAESLGALLHALATGHPDRAFNLVQTSPELTDQERELLWSKLSSTDDPSVQARSLGDALRTGTGWDFASNECYRAAFYIGNSIDRLRDDPLFGYFRMKRTGRVLDKWVHYFPVYTRHFEPFRGRAVKILEIGVYRGGSLDMWSWYFGPQVTIVGVDIDERAREASDPRHTIEIGDQTDVEFLRGVNERHGPFDLIIDDGGHEMAQQIVTAETLFPLLADGGVLLVEDCHTSYWPDWGGGRGRPGTFIEWAKERVDDINGYHQPAPVDRLWTDHLDAAHFYDSIVVFDKRSRYAPFAEQVGLADFLNYPRSSAQLFTELLATRDAALAERDRVLIEHQEHADAEELQEEIRILRGELKGLRPQAAALGDRLRRARVELDSARAAVRELRQLGQQPGDDDPAAQ